MISRNQLIAGFKFSDYAQAFGYTDDSAGIENAQRFAGIPVTGDLDALTVNVLARTPRCGCTDAQPVSGRLDRWKPGLVVTYCVAGYPTESGLSKEQVLNVVKRCCDAWSAVCGIKFQRVTDPGEAHIVMNKGRGQSAGFDGPSGILAWCEIPQGNAFQGQLQLRWDLEELWVDDATANGIQLMNVTCHELGHGIGHYHNNVQAQLLNPIYNARIGVPQSYDIQEAQSRYGKPVIVAAPTDAPIPGGSTPFPRRVKVLSSDGRVYGGELTELPPSVIASEQGW